MKYKHILLKLHFGLLLFLSFNLVVRQLTDISLSSYIVFVLKITIYITGLILLFFTIKPFEKKAMYFSIYLLSPLSVLLAWMVDGIFGAIIGSLFFWVISVDDFIAKNNNHKISQPFAGFLAPCCKYNLKKDYFFLIEKKLGDFSFDEPSLSSFTFTVDEKKRTLNLNYQLDNTNKKNQFRDTTLFLN